MARPEVRVTVVCCAPGCEDLTEVTLPAGATVADAIGASGVLDRRPEVAATPPDVGIWGRACALTQRLQDGDRVELYRPLTVDPKEARRVRAEVRRRRSGRR
jgi:putative ubiquitin-RnfH superfamily antitoxin RatB of RatAB toxin-antitoxin module